MKDLCTNTYVVEDILGKAYPVILTSNFKLESNAGPRFEINKISTHSNSAYIITYCQT